MDTLTRVHLCQDEYGFWFVVEADELGMRLVAHSTSYDAALEDAEQVRDRTDGELHEEVGRLPYPEGGLVAGYQPPEPREAKR
jgi:hypothetical protein